MHNLKPKHRQQPHSLLAAASPIPITPLITRTALARVMDCSTKHITELTSAGVLPPPVRVGKRVYWRASTIEQWIDEQIEGYTVRGRRIARAHRHRRTRRAQA